jgi:predicted nuclease of restriction endonuclease-like (RecB) superfamily
MGMQENTSYLESDLEQCIIDNLQKFLMELGKGYAFVARQQHIHTEKETLYERYTLNRKTNDLKVPFSYV